MIIIAKLGGYLNRKCDGLLGFQCLWKGYARFNDMVRISILRDTALSQRALHKRRVNFPGQAQG